MTTVGKHELLSWAAIHSGVACSKYDDLKDGTVFLSLFGQLFPSLLDSVSGKVQKSNPKNVKLAWDVLREGMVLAGLPLHVCDRKAISSGHQRPCYNMLILFFFLTKLTESSEFSVDFTHPIDETLAEFLQSPKSLECLAAAARAVPLPELPHHSALRSVSPSHPIPSPTSKSQTKPGGNSISAVHPVAAKTTPTAGSGKAATKTQIVEPTNNTWIVSSDPQRGEAVIVKLQRDLNAANRQKEMIRSEMEHLRAMCHHTIQSQRVVVESEVARAEQQMQVQVSSLKLEHSFAVQQVAKEMYFELDKLHDEISFERSTAVDTRPVEVLHAELLEVRQRRAADESRICLLERENRTLQDAISALKDVVEGQRVSFDKLHEQLNVSMANLDKEDLPSEVFLGLSVAQQFPLLAKVKALRLQLETLKISSARAIEAPSEGTDAPSEHSEVARLTLLLERQKRTIDFLHQHFEKLKRNAPNDRDLHKAVLSFDVEAPSCVLGNSTVEEICSVAFQRVEGIKHILSQPDHEALHLSFWGLVSASRILQSRLEQSVATITSLHKRHAALSTECIITSHKNEQQLAESQAEQRRNFESDHLQMAQETNELKLQNKIMAEELRQNRADIDRAGTQLAQAGASMAVDCERPFQAINDQLLQMSNTMASLRGKEELYQQLADLSESRAKKASSSEKQVLETRISDLLIQLRRMPNTASSSLQSQLESSSLKGAVVSLKTRIDSWARDLTISIKERSRSNDEIILVKRENESLRGNAQKLVARVGLLEAQCERVRTECEALQEDAAGHEAQLQSAEIQHSNLFREHEQHFTALVRFLEVDESVPLPQRSKTPTMNGKYTVPLQRRTADVTTATPHTEPQQQSSSAVVSSVTPAATPHRSGGDAPVNFLKSSSILSSEELERRKREIMAKYGVK